MKLSEAIRLGAMLGPQCFNMAHDDQGATCALGAALVAKGHDRPEMFTDANRFWSWLMEPPAPSCPACMAVHCDTGDSMDVITHLNDDHQWTREQIADWVATIEQQQEQAAKDDLAARVEAGGCPI